jgi:hypothetical protein
MKLKYLLPIFVLFGFTACDEDDILQAVLGDAVAIEDGYYVSECEEDGQGGSFITNLLISNGTTMRTLQVDTFTDAACSVGEVPGTPDDATIELANFGFGNNTSFLTESVSGEDDVYLPYHVDGDDLYVGADVDSLEGEPTEIFADFIDNPTSGTRFTRVIVE